MTALAEPPAVDPEASVVAHMLAAPDVIGEVVGSLLAAGHFKDPAYRALYAQLVDAWHEDRSTDPLTVGRLAAKTIAPIWGVPDSSVIARVQSLAAAAQGDVLEHANLIRRDHGYRELTQLSTGLLRDVSLELQPPDLLAGEVAMKATDIAIGTLRDREIISLGELGDDFAVEQQEVMAAREQGIEAGAHFGLSFLDNITRGLLPTELFFLAGPPGAGKSGVAWRASMNFAERQARTNPDDPVGVFVLSLEMGKRPSSIRIASALARVQGGKLREGVNSAAELASVNAEWGIRRNHPLFFNFSSTLRASQVRALCVEAVQKHNVGVVVIDHMRYFDMDGRYQSKLEEDEDKARFLKQSLAKELDVAVICLAHTTKGFESTEDKRPSLSHLRGSGQIAAEGDFVAFVHRPWLLATDAQKAEGKYQRTDAVMIAAKNRHEIDTDIDFYLDLSTLTMY